MRIALFATCLGDALYPDVSKATVRVLERLGHTVGFPAGQTCCGQMHINSGYLDEAAPLVRHHVETFEAALADCDADRGAVRLMCRIGAASARDGGPCARRRTGGQRSADRAEAVAAKTYELSEFLVDVLGVTDVGAYYPHRVTYHPTCHSLRLLHVGDKPVQLLRAVRGLDLIELPAADSCCGFGGMFAVKNPDVSTAMLADKMSNVLSTKAEVCTAGDSSCLMHIGGGLSRLRAGVRAVHLAEILASTEEAS